MPRFEFALRSQASPEAVRAALLDFTERRPELWPGLPADSYEIYEVGDTWAEIREGYRGPIWWRERYDWSAPGRIRWTAVDSGFGMPGSYVVWRIEPAEGGGSRHHITWDRRGKTVFGKLFMALMVLTRGILIRRSLKMGLTTIAAQRNSGKPWKPDVQQPSGTADAGLIDGRSTRAMESTPCNQHDGDHAHVHIEEACGHEYMAHEDHLDYEHAGHWHAKHGDHWDEHPGPEGANPVS